MNEAPAAVPTPPKRKRPPRPPSRPKRWATAASEAAEALSTIEGSLDALDTALAELRSIQEEFESWKDNMSENLASSPTGDKLEAVCELEIDTAADGIREAIEAVREVIDSAEGLDLPRGYGKD